MTKVTKAANYDQKTIDTMIKMYQGKDNKSEVKAIAAKINRSEAAVRSKLSNLGVYVTVKAAKPESGRVKKADIVADIAKEIGGLSEPEMDGLEKATAAPLQKILDRLTAKSKPESK